MNKPGSKAVNLSVLYTVVGLFMLAGANAHAKKVKPLDQMPQAPGPGDAICKNFDPLTANLNDFDYRTLAWYRQTEYRAEDPFSDHALWTEFRLQVKDKIDRIHGNQNARNLVLYSNRDEANETRAEACMKLPPLPPPPRQDTVAPFVDEARFTDALRKAGLSNDEISRVLAKKSQFTILGHENPFAVKEFSEGLFQVIHEEADLTPSSASPTKWSKKFLRTENTFTRAVQKIASKLLVALGNGTTSRHFRVGTEDNLREWILAQPERSIFPTELFRQSYRLNKGDVYLSILAIENVLSEYFLIGDRENLVQTNKLGMILNHLNGYMDLYGPWYHLWGTILFGYVAGPIEGMVAADAEMLNGIFAKDASNQEDLANRKGIDIGVQLRRFMKNEEWKNLESHPEYLVKERYLHLDEDYSDKIQKFWKEHQSEFPGSQPAPTPTPAQSE